MSAEDSPRAPLQAPSPWLANIDEARRILETSGDERRAAYLLRHGSMRVGLYAPRGDDRQTPHDQDELYIVVRGEADFVRGDARRPLRVGDVVFVPAGETHRFVDFTGDFETWVVFWGSIGGEPSA